MQSEKLRCNVHEGHLLPSFLKTTTTTTKSLGILGEDPRILISFLAKT